MKLNRDRWARHIARADEKYFLKIAMRKPGKQWGKLNLDLKNEMERMWMQQLTKICKRTGGLAK